MHAPTGPTRPGPPRRAAPRGERARSPARGRRTPRSAPGAAARSAAVAASSYDSESSSSEPVSTTPYDASAASGETLRQTTSRTTSAGSRSSGSPQPPPPVVRIRITSPAATGSASARASTSRSWGPPGSMTTSNGLPAEPALDAPAGQDRPVGDGHEVAVLEHPDVLLVAEAAAELARSPAVHRQRQRLDAEREARLGELGRQVPRVGHDVDGVLAVGVVAAAGAAAEHLAHQVGPAVEVVAVDAGVADRLLVGGHPAVDRLGDHAGEHAEQPQDHEGAGVGRRREDRRQQGAGRREPHLDQRHDALVDVELGHPLGGLGEVAQDRRQPLLEEDAVAVVAAVVDRPLGLGRGAVEVEDQPLAVRVVGRRAGQRDPLGVQHRLVDAVVLGVVLPHPLPTGIWPRISRR